MAERNPDIQLIRDYLAGDRSPRMVESNQLARALGTEITGYDANRGELRIAFSPGEAFKQGAGVVQGGAVAAMLDFAMAYACFTVLPDGSTVATTTMSANFMGAASGDRIEATGRIDKAGRRVMFASAELRSGGRLVASATSSLLVLPGG